MKNKYNDGMHRNIKYIPKDEIEIALSEWAEGSQELYDLLKKCYDMGIETITSCPGHENKTGPDAPYLPYINIKIDDKSEKHIFSILENLKNENNICYDFHSITPEGEKDICTFATINTTYDSIPLFRLLNEKIGQTQELPPKEYAGMYELFKMFSTSKMEPEYFHIKLYQNMLLRENALSEVSIHFPHSPHLVQMLDVFNANLDVNNNSYFYRHEKNEVVLNKITDVKNQLVKTLSPTKFTRKYDDEELDR